MSAARRRLARTVAAVYAAVCAVLWPVPVFGLLHAESSAVVAGVGCLLAALTSVRAFETMSLRAVVQVQLAALAVPLGLLTLSLLWRPNCGYLQGLGLFALLVPPSVLLGVALAWAATGFGVRWPRLTLAVAVLAVAVGGVLWSLLRHPQLFTYSSVFGGVLGPIYDQELAVRPGLWAAKAQTLLWAAGLVLLGHWRRTRDRRSGIAALVVGAALALGVAASGALGTVQTERGLQAQLSARLDLGPVVLHLDPETSEATRQRLAAETLYRFETLSQALDVRPTRAVQVYLYPDADTKAALIGSRETSVVPVWLATPQIHMLVDQVPYSLGHEMVHVLAREFGAPVLRASPAVGLVEGLAVALEPPDGLPSASALVRAGMELGEEEGGLPDPAQAVRATMSPGGFWTARAGVAYTANGAFVGWLLDQFGAAPLQAAYRTGRFDAYGRSLDSLARQWGAEVAATPLDPEALAVARWRFSRPSLFEVRCPHHVPVEVRWARDGREAREDGDERGAASAFSQAVIANPLLLPALDGRLQSRLALGRSPDGLQLALALADSLRDASSLRHLADVRRLTDGGGDADYRAAADSLAPVDALGRLLLWRRSQLPAPVLRALLAAPPDRVPPLVQVRAPVLAALIDAGADRPAVAWETARRWCRPALVAGLDSALASEGDRVLRWLQARLASRAGALDASARLYGGLADEFDQSGPRSWAALVADGARERTWRARLAVTQPSILGLPLDAPDDLAPDCPAARLGAGLGLRVARGGPGRR